MNDDKTFNHGQKAPTTPALDDAELERQLMEPLAQLVACYADDDGREHYDRFIVTVRSLIDLAVLDGQREVLERLKQYNGSFIEGALRHDNYLHHSVVDQELAKLNEEPTDAIR